MRGPLPLLALVATTFVTGAAFACDTAAPAEFEIRADASDDTPPAAPSARVERVKRGKPPEREGCSQHVSSCDDIAYVLIDVSAAGESDVGYVFEVEGRAPQLLVPGHPIAPNHFEPGKLRLHWEDGEGERNYDFTIEVWSVDRAGNMSETSTRLRIDNDGSDGCSARSARDSDGAWLGALCALLFVRRPRRATRSM